MSSKKKIFIQGPIQPSVIADSISKHSAKKEIGAHSIFLGQVRNDLVDGHHVASIEYTAYEEMAEEIVHEIREAVFSKYALTCMHIYHSLGNVRAGGLCLFVFTSSKHRIDAVKACEEIVERIKSEVPVWGKESLENNEYVWKAENPHKRRIAHG